MLRHEDVAQALLTEARMDRQAAEVLRDAGIFARCVAHCQQAVEKALKAALAVRHVIVTDRHDVSEDFRQTYADWPEAAALADIAAGLETVGFRAEYPLFGRADLPIWIPSERYTEEEAQRYLEEAVRVVEAIERHLAEPPEASDVAEE
jgi:HEPN domain-containing protein